MTFKRAEQKWLECKEKREFLLGEKNKAYNAYQVAKNEWRKNENEYHYTMGMTTRVDDEEED